MTQLTWRTYRSAGQAPVEVLSKDRARYELNIRAKFTDQDLHVGNFSSARAVLSGKRFEDGSTLPASLLRDDHVIIDPDTEYGLSKLVAQPDELPRTLTEYHRPRMVGAETVMTPGSAKPAPNEWKILEATPIEPGLFLVEPGHIGQAVIRVRGENTTLSFDYDPAGGAIYVENQDGNPVATDAPVELLVYRRHTLRQNLSGVREPIYHNNGKDVIATAERRPANIKDIRSHPEFDKSTRWHALDQAHYDASPVPDGHFWILRTDAETDKVRDAARRTLPAGSVYRIEPFPSQIKTQSPSDAYLLDYVSNPITALSLQYISPSYSDPVIQALRGDGDNHPVELRDFTPTEIKDGTLIEWANQADGRASVATWYDQSGNDNHAEKMLIEDQPIIAVDGSLVTKNGHPAVYQTSNGQLDVTLNTPIDSYSVSIVGGADDMSTEPAFYEIGTGETENARRVVQATTEGRWEYAEKKFMAERIEYTRAGTTGVNSHVVTHRSGDLRILFGDQIHEESITNPAPHDKIILFNDVNGGNHGAYMQEAVFYSRDLTEYEEERLSISGSQRHDIS